MRKLITVIDAEGRVLGHASTYMGARRVGNRAGFYLPGVNKAGYVVGGRHARDDGSCILVDISPGKAEHVVRNHHYRSPITDRRD